MLKFLAVALILTVAEGEIFERPCRTIEEYGGAQENFQWEQYAGLWYQIERYNNFQLGVSNCNQAMYSHYPEPFTLESRFKSKNFETGNVGGISGVSRLSFPHEPHLRGLFNATMGPYPVTDVVNFMILETDYENFSFVVNCDNLNATHSSESFWLYGRTFPLPEHARTRADQKAREVLDVSRIRPVIQGPPDCELNWFE